MTFLKKFASQIATAAVLVLVTTAFVTVLAQFLGQEAKPQKKVVQVQLLRPTPPPPPVEPPPPPPPQEEVKLPEPQPVADAPEVPEMPGPLGLDAEGSAGSDAFGLMGRKGGRDLIGGDGPYRSYAMQVKDRLLDYLSDRDDVRGSTYSILVQMWILDDGQLGRYEIIGSSGNPKLDQSLELALADLTKVGGAPPEGMPQPVRLRIKSRA